MKKENNTLSIKVKGCAGCTGGIQESSHQRAPCPENEIQPLCRKAEVRELGLDFDFAHRKVGYSTVQTEYPHGTVRPVSAWKNPESRSEQNPARHLYQRVQSGASTGQTAALIRESRDRETGGSDNCHIVYRNWHSFVAETCSQSCICWWANRAGHFRVMCSPKG